MATNEDLILTASTDIMSDYAFDEDYYSDYYSSNISDERCNKPAVIHFGAIFTPVFFSIVVIFSLFGNILIIVILAKFENFRSLTNTFILNLAISDLFFTAGLPFWAYYHMHGWDLGEVACKTVSFVFYIGFYSSGILLILMTAHRYLAVMYPLSNIVSATGASSVIASVIIWAVSILVASPGYLFTTSPSNHCVYKDSNVKLWGIYQQNVLFIVSLMVFVYCYAKIIYRLLHPPVQRRRSKTLKLIFTLMVVFFVGWGPYNIVLFLHSLSFWTPSTVDPKTLAAKCESEKSLDYALYVSRLFAFSHCCLNPVFYVFLGIKFKNHLKKMLKSWGNNKRSSIHSRQSRLTIISVTSGEEFSM